MVQIGMEIHCTSEKGAVSKKQDLALRKVGHSSFCGSNCGETVGIKFIPYFCGQKILNPPRSWIVNKLVIGLLFPLK